MKRNHNGPKSLFSRLPNVKGLLWKCSPEVMLCNCVYLDADGAGSSSTVSPQEGGKSPVIIRFNDFVDAINTAVSITKLYSILI